MISQCVDPDVFDAVISHDDVDGDGCADEVLDGAATVRLVAEIEPGPLAMTLLRSIDVSKLDEDERIDLVAAWERQQAWVAAQAQQALATVPFAAPDPGPQILSPEEMRNASLAATLHWSPLSAACRLDAAQRLVASLPGTFALLQAGEISPQHARVIAEEVEQLTPAEMAAVEARVLGRAPTQTVAEFTRSVRRAVIRVAPVLAAERHQRARAERGVRRVARPDGMAALIATLTAADADTIWQALDATARAGCDQSAHPGSEPIDARRADALLAWAQAALADPTLPRRQGRRVEIQVAMDAATLFGLADQPAELIGYGPIPADAARLLAADATWRRLLVDPVDGHLLDFGSLTYRPPQALIDFVVARDRRCRFPGCARRADACDIDHVHPYHAGGATAACNCCTLCRHHHRLKTHGGWHLQLHPDGSVTWTNPGGRTFHVYPEPQLE